MNRDDTVFEQLWKAKRQKSAQKGEIGGARGLKRDRRLKIFDCIEASSDFSCKNALAG